MSKNRNINKESHYKNIINKQKRIIQDLKKKASRAGKIEERYNDLEEREQELLEILEEDEHQPSEYSCPKCKGELYVIDGGKRKVFICQDCNYRASKR